MGIRLSSSMSARLLQALRKPAIRIYGLADDSYEQSKVLAI